MSKAIILAVVVTPLLLTAQQTTGALNGQETTRLFHLRYAEPERVKRLMGPEGFQIEGDSAMKVVIVHGDAQKLATAEQLIRELDQPASVEPQRDIQVIVYVLGAGEKSTEPGTVPEEMRPVVNQLKSIFPYESYRLLDTMLIRSGEGRSANTQGVMREFPASSASGRPYGINYSTARVMAGPEQVIHFEHFSFSSSLPNEHSASFNTDVDVRSGQKVVIGKTNVDGSSSALFVVLTASVLQEGGKGGETDRR